jgi:glutathione synthase/RimK-type ligase-like ATP-grasp enzyme
LPITKVGELAVLADNSVPLPRTFMSSNREVKKLFKKNAPIDFPIIVKAADGYGGKNNHLVKSYAQLKDILGENKGVHFVIQEFIPNDRDYRCLVFGGEIKLLLKRSRDAVSESHLNNTSAGAIGEIVPIETISEEARRAVVAAAEALNRSEFAGVDLMIHSETGAPYIIEVNQTPQIEIGAEVDQKMDVLLNYMEERMR